MLDTVTYLRLSSFPLHNRAVTLERPKNGVIDETLQFMVVKFFSIRQLIVD